MEKKASYTTYRSGLLVAWYKFLKESELIPNITYLIPKVSFKWQKQHNKSLTDLSCFLGRIYFVTWQMSWQQTLDPLYVKFSSHFVIICYMQNDCRIGWDAHVAGLLLKLQVFYAWSHAPCFPIKFAGVVCVKKYLKLSSNPLFMRIWQW